MNNILAVLDIKEPPIFFFTGKNNFRERIAKERGYKANRDGTHKPYHWLNLEVYIKGKWDWKQEEGIEADDLLGIEQTDETIICSRDKDLRQVSGFHFGWELHNQPQFGPMLIDELGFLREPNKGKLLGGGHLFFFSQLLTGDLTDNIPGLPKFGPARAYKVLKNVQSYDEGLELVLNKYLEHFNGDKEKALDYLEEQGKLLWIIRDRNPDNSPKIWSLNYYGS